MTPKQKAELERIRGSASGIVTRIDNLLKPADPNVQSKPVKTLRWKHADMEMAQYLLAKVQANLPFVKTPTQAAMDTWADSIYMLRNVDKYNEKQIQTVIDWATNDDFWKANIRSAPTLRKQFETLLAQMQRQSGSLI